MRCGRWRMKRTQVHSTANPNSRAPAPAMANMTKGFSNRSATSAPSHRPTCEAAHAHAGVSSHPTTTSKCAIHLGTVPLPLAGDRDDREPRKYEREARAGGNGQIDGEAGGGAA